MNVCKLADAPRFTVLKRTKDVPHSASSYVFWGGCYIPGREGQIPHGVCFDLFGSPVHIRLSERVRPHETSRSYQDKMREWYWSMTVLEPVHWMKVKKEETCPLRLGIRAVRAWETSGLIRVARKRAA